MYQKLIIVGNLGRDPEMRYLPDGTAVTNFSVACGESYTNAQGEKVDKTTWIRVAVWRKQAETVNQYLSKGSKVLCEGTLTPDKETGSPRVFTRQDGTAGASYEMNAQVVRFLSSRGEDTRSAAYADDDGPPSGLGDTVEDDIPF